MFVIISFWSILRYNVVFRLTLTIVTSYLINICVQVGVTQYNVTWRHYKYEACDTRVTNNRSYESSFVPAPNKRLVIEDKLLSYSVYEVWVGAQTLNDYYEVQGASEVFSTGQSPPEIRTGAGEILETERYGQVEVITN